MAETVVAARPGVGAINRSWGRGDGPARLARSARAKYVPRWRGRAGKAPRGPPRDVRRGGDPVTGWERRDAPGGARPFTSGCRNRGPASTRRRRTGGRRAGLKGLGGGPDAGITPRGGTRSRAGAGAGRRWRPGLRARRPAGASMSGGVAVLAASPFDLSRAGSRPWTRGQRSRTSATRGTALPADYETRPPTFFAATTDTTPGNISDQLCPRQRRPRERRHSATFRNPASRFTRRIACTRGKRRPSRTATARRARQVTSQKPHPG